jgi:hypothetical protein
MFRRLGGFSLLAVAGLVAALLVAAPASADPPIVAYGDPYPVCGTGGDTDGRYCVESFLRNGVRVTPPGAGAQAGVYDDPYVVSAGETGVLFGVVRTTIDQDGRTSVREVDPKATWTFTVNTGAIVPRQVNGRVRDLRFVQGGSATSHRFRITFHPTPVAFADFDEEEPCIAGYWCGEDTTVATEVHRGYADGGVDDGTAFAQQPDLLGEYANYTWSSNAQDYAALRDSDLNALEVKLANPHLRSPGVRATGYYETFLPNQMLVRAFHVVNPTALSRRSFTVERVDSTDPVSFTVTRERGGIRVVINAIGYSAPVYRIRPKATRPGAPPAVGVRRIARHQVRVIFRAPTDGGARVTSYAARCHGRGGAWHYGRSKTSPITVRHVPRRKVTCQLRAVNKVGVGPWSAARRR